MRTPISGGGGGRDNITVIAIHIIGHPNVIGGDQAGYSGTTALPVDYDTDEASHSTMIHGISTAGGFIITTDAFTIGQELDLTFTDPSSGDAFMISGTVADRKADGIDIEFEDLSEKQIAKLKKAIQHS